MQSIEPGRAVEERPLRDIVAQLSRDGSLLVKQEVAIAKQELDDKLAKAQADIAAIGVGAAVLYAGALTLISAVVLLLGQLMAVWLAALLVGAVVSTAGAVLALRAKRNLGKLDIAPKKAIEGVKRDVAVIEEAAR
jgi:hypothetical protein